MKMSGACEIVQVEVGILQIKGGTRVGENLAVLGEGKDYGHPGSLVWKAFHARDVNATFHETFHAEFAERVASDARSETNTAAQERNIVGKDCRGAAEGHRKIVGQVFSLGFKYCRKTIQNQIAVQFTQNADVKTLHSVVSFFPTTVLCERPAQCAKRPPAQCGRGMSRGNSTFRKQPQAPDFVRTKGRLRQRRLIQQEPNHRSQR